MISLAYLAYWALICSYNPTPGVFSRVMQIGDITVCLIFMPGKTVVVFPGSEQFIRDWIKHDLLAIPIEHARLGTLHKGFYDGMDAVVAAIWPLIAGDLYVAGHSLGGARAALFSALVGIKGKRTHYIALFESPRPGCKTFQDFLATVIDDHFSCVNDIDLVPDAPTDPWLHPIADFMNLHAKPGGLENIDPIEYHLSATILPAIRALPKAGLAI